MLDDESRITPQFCLLKLDETRHWAESIASRAGRIFGLYHFDANTKVHACELTPSYECRFIGSQHGSPALDDAEADDLDDDIREGDTQAEPIRYVHCHEIDALPRIREADLTTGVSDLGIEDEEQAIESVQRFL